MANTTNSQGQAPIFTQPFFFTSDLLGLEQRICHHCVFSRQGGSNDTHFGLKRCKSKFDLRSEVRSGHVGHVAYHSIRGLKKKTYWCHFYSSITPDSKVKGDKPYFPP